MPKSAMAVPHCFYNIRGRLAPTPVLFVLFNVYLFSDLFGKTSIYGGIVKESTNIRVAIFALLAGFKLIP